MIKMTVPLEIKRIKDPAGETNFRAVVNIEDVFRHSNTMNHLRKIERDYAEFVEKGKKLIKEIQRSKANKADTRLHWALGNLIVHFLQETSSKGYILTNIPPTLSRDLGLSGRYFSYHIQLREYYPNVDLIHNEISWAKYQELLSIKSVRNRNVCIKKILEGEIVTRSELRELKRSIARQELTYYVKNL